MGERIEAVELRRLRWRCRRGLLENDLVLSRFLEIHARDLDSVRLATLNELLALDDNTLWDLISGRAEAAAGAHAEMIRWLRAA